ncbi:caspase recruitment domain-containing protein 19 [Electrophorus electricus]|uniref:caspase recruitment domain-containing protein 19 n=1 Tax=Electrophorus electricus TaxID=8005 RepID=UPI0015CFA4B1|nr:caspase recruitment domain-containing protein 19 [Electrophorus electricus]
MYLFPCFFVETYKCLNTGIWYLVGIYRNVEAGKSGLTFSGSGEGCRHLFHGEVAGVSKETKMGDSFHEQLRLDSWFLKSDHRLDTELVDKIILQLNRIYPQILTDKEATKFRDLDVPTCVRLDALLTHLQQKREEACREFYSALHLHAEEVYFSLPTRLRRRTESMDTVLNPVMSTNDRFVLNDQGPLFFLSCFSAVVGAALLYYHGDFKTVSGSSSALGLAALGIGRKVREVLIWYTEDSLSR